MTEKTMQDVSHTPPYGTDANRVWERGNEYETDETETPPASADEAPTPADD